MEGNNLRLLIAAFIVLIVGVSLLTVIASEGSNVRDKVDADNESIDIGPFRDQMNNNTCNESYGPITLANAPTTWRLNAEYGCYLSSITMGNPNGTVFANGTDYVIYENNGTWKCIDSATFNYTSTNNTYIDYTYCPDTYLTQSWARTMIGTVPGFFSIALIAVAIGMFYVILKREGLMNV